MQLRKINFTNQVKVHLQFLVVEFCSDDTNQQIFLKALLVEKNMTRIFNFANKVRSSWKFFSNFSFALDIYNRQYRRHPRFLLRRALQALMHTLGFDSRFGLPRLLWSASPRRALRASIQILGEFWTSIFKIFDCFGCHCRALTRALGLPWVGAPAGHWTGLLKQHAGMKSGFGSIRPLLPIFTSFLHHYYLLWQ